MAEAIVARKSFRTQLLINQDGPVSPLPIQKKKKVCKKVTIKKKASFKLFQMLPFELQCEIMKFVSFNDLCAMQSTSKHLKQIASENLVWKAIYQNHFNVSEEALDEYSFSIIKNWQSHFKIQYLLLKQKYIQSEKMICESKPQSRFAHTAAVHNSNIYYIGGQMSEARSDEIWGYNPQQNNFQQVALTNVSNTEIPPSTFDCYSFPGIDGKLPKFARHQSAILGNKVYSFGGYDYTYFYNLAVFDIVARTWTYPEVKGDIPLPRSNHALTVIGNKLYIFGGSIGDKPDKYTVTNDFYILDIPTLTWSKIPTSPETPSVRVGHVMTSIGKNLYMFGGGVWGKEMGWTEQSNDLYIYSTEKQKWTMMKLKPEEKPAVCTYPFVFTLNNNLFLFGGAAITGTTVTNKLYMWDVIVQKWTEMTVAGEEISARSIGTASVVGDEVFLLGGYCGGLLAPESDFYKLKITLPFKKECLGIN